MKQLCINVVNFTLGPMSNQQNWPDIDGNSNKCLPTDKNIATVYITV